MIKTTILRRFNIKIAVKMKVLFMIESIIRIQFCPLHFFFSNVATIMTHVKTLDAPDFDHIKMLTEELSKSLRQICHFIRFLFIGLAPPAIVQNKFSPKKD